MADNIKLLASTITLTTVSTVNSAKVVRVVNTTASPSLITQKYANGTVIGTVVLGAAGCNFDSESVLKQPTDTLESNSASGVYAVSVGYY
jgi:hypothetical protein